MHVVDVLRTARLRLEPLGPQHAAALLAYYERNREHLEPWEPQRSADFFTLAHHALEGERAVVAAAQERDVRFIVFERDGTEIVGLMNLWNIRRGVVQAAIIGYSIDAAHEGRGYATEAGHAVVDYAFETLRLHRIETSYQPTNERSGRVLRKLGFTVEGYARDYLYLNGAWRDAILVARTNASAPPPRL
jgi:[ribosomal protein S5]-alanine N-acetyltransferase